MNLFYFAYGSNIHPVRLNARITGVKTVALCSIEKYALRFHKRGKDGSAKCSMLHTGNPDDNVYGVVYEINMEDLIVLDKYEGLNCGYMHQELTLFANGSSLNALTYVAMQNYIDHDLQPYKWYRKMVISGLTYYRFDVKYIEQIKKITAMEDPDPARNRENCRILKKMEEFNGFRLKKRA